MSEIHGLDAFSPKEIAVRAERVADGIDVLKVTAVTTPARRA